MHRTFPSCFPAELRSGSAGRERDEQLSGGKVLRLIQTHLAMAIFAKISLGCQGHSRQDRIADSTSTNAISFSSARTTKRFPALRWRFVAKKQCTPPAAM